MPPLTTAGIRRLLNKVFNTPADFDAFVIDAFQDTHRDRSQRIRSVSDHVAQLNLLLSLFSDELSVVLNALTRLQPERTSRYRYLLKPDAPDEQSAPSSPAILDSAMVARLLGYGEPLLKCDRELPWHDFHQFMDARGHGLMLLPGAVGEAHVFFLIRVEKSVARLKTPCRVVWTSWLRRGRPPFPTGPAEVEDQLVLALRAGSAKELKYYLKAQLAEHNLVFLSDPPINRGYCDEAITDWWHKWIPELLATLKTRYFCKFVQPIAWTRVVGTRRRVTARLSRTLLQGPLNEASEEALSYDLAKELMTRLQRGCTSWLTVVKTRELCPIKRPDVLNFLSITGYASELSPTKAEQERENLADRVLRGDPTSEEILRALCRELPDSTD